MHIVGSGALLLDRGWIPVLSGVAQGMLGRCGDSTAPG